MSAAISLFIDKRWPESVAFRELAPMRTGRPMQVLLLFCKKRKVAKEGRKGHEKWSITNNGEIVFTYDEARDKHGIPKDAFKNAIRALIRVGFIDIAHQGAGGRDDPSLYAFSDRWKQFGTPQFQPPPKPTGLHYRRGFKEGNELWKRRKDIPMRSDTHVAMRDETHVSADTKISPAQ